MSGLNSYVIGIGASAGGLEALTSLFKAMPSDSGLVFIVVQHLSPNTKSMLHELLAAHTAMQVMPAENGMSVAPNCVYIQPPQTNLNLFKGRLLLDDAASQAGLHLPIDYFFRSLAEDRKDRAVGIILSGTGSDGSQGVAAIRQAGGMIMVQEPTDASFNGMPNSERHRHWLSRLHLPSSRDAWPLGRVLVQSAAAPGCGGPVALF